MLKDNVSRFSFCLAVFILLFAGFIVFFSQNAKACFALGVTCEDESMFTDDGGAVDVEYHALHPCARRVVAGNEYDYMINFSYAPDCGFVYSAKLAVLPYSHPSGWNVSLVNESSGLSCWGVQMTWHDSGYFLANLSVKTPSGAATGETGRVTVRLWVNDTDACNEHNTVDTFTTTIVSTYPNLNLTVNSPKGGEVWEVGTKHNITWIASGGLGSLVLKLEYATGVAPVVWNVIAENVSNNGTFTWIIPATPSTTCLFKILVNDSDSPPLTRNATIGFFTIRNPVPEMPVLPVFCFMATVVLYATRRKLRRTTDDL